MTKWGDADGRRRDILRAAATLLARDGYEALTMRAIAERAKVSPGTVYHYYAGKEELFAVLYAERLDRLRTELTPELDAATTAEAALTAAARHYFDIFDVFGRALNAWSEAQAPTEANLRLAHTSRSIFSDVRKAVERLEPAIADAEILEPLVWSTFFGLADHFAGPRRLLHPAYDRDRLTQVAAQIIVSGARTALGGRLHAPPPEGRGG